MKIMEKNTAPNKKHDILGEVFSHVPFSAVSSSRNYTIRTRILNNLQTTSSKFLIS